MNGRVYIAAPNAPIWERLLLKDTEFQLSGSGDNGKIAFAEIQRLMPDVLILDCTLSGMDGFSLLDSLGKSMIAPPRILFISPIEDEKWLTLARKKGAERAVYQNASGREMLTALLETANEPIPALCRNTEALRLSLAENLLSCLGVSPRLKGREYIRLSAAICAGAPSLAHGYNKRLYPMLAEKYATTPQAVERAIRTAIENTWLHGNLEAIQNLFGFSVDADRGKPTNAEFLSMLSEHVRREGQKQLCYP